MNADEQEIYDFLNGFPDTYVSTAEISNKLGKGRKSNGDRLWARPILRRMEMDGLLECNSFGEYKVKTPDTKELLFKDALKTPGASLGDTTIIKIGDVQNRGTAVSK